MMATVPMPPNFEWGFAGDVEMMQESAAAMGLAMILAIAFIYIVLASQFESFTEPFLIMLSLPLAVVGALLALLLTGNNIGMPAMIGVVMLMGLVTKNAILLVDLTNHYHREEGLSIKDAILKAGPIRLRPILMTTLAMILGMLPSATASGEGGEFRAPISIATIGGLITSTALTLVVVPVAYLLLARHPRAAGGVAPALAGAVPAGDAHRRRARAAGAGRLVLGQRDGVRADPAGRRAAASAPMTLTFDDALQRALSANESLKVVAENVRIGEARVAEAQAAFLPDAAVNFQYLPWQKFPEIRIPAGVFGPEEQTFEAAFARQNAVSLEMSQPLYTGGRLTSNRSLQRAGADRVGARPRARPPAAATCASSRRSTAR